MLVLKSILQKLVRIGTLNIIDASGRIHTFSGRDGPTVTAQFHDRWLPWKITWAPGMAFGEGYMNGRLTVKDGTIYDFLALMAQNVEVSGYNRIYSLAEFIRKFFKTFQQFNPVTLARKHVAHHYDLSGQLYELFLDRDRQYSCAYFDNPKIDLETAQTLKKQHLAAKLMIAPGQSILDIGSGWGGMGVFLAKNLAARVTGITLSAEQLKVSRELAKTEGLKDQVEFYLRDYRDQTGVFDRIVSVGMFEHVGIGYFETYFRKCKELLTDDGIAIVHTIGRSGPPGVTDVWIRKYIFPGGYIPALSEVVPVIEKVGLIITDIEFLGPHYAETLRHWQVRFQANRGKVKNIYDERFCRMWEFYLAASEISFRYLDMTVFQIQFAKKNGTVPITRDYIGKFEKEFEDLGKDNSRAA